MKHLKKLAAIFFSLVFILGLAPAVQLSAFAEDPLLDLSSASDWAHDHITEAHEKGIVPEELLHNFQSPITRLEFCRLSVQWLIVTLDEGDIVQILQNRGLYRNPNAFTDTDDPDILAAYALGITSGMGDGRFNPDGEITREQAAVMVGNAVRAIGSRIAGFPQADFADMAAASSWAHRGINFVSHHGIMSGVSNNNFAPSVTYTREQSIATFNQIDVDELSAPFFIALTFDDGPNTCDERGTVAALNVLARYGARATFFVNGMHINEDTVPVLQRIIDEGHTVENHGWSHADFTRPSQLVTHSLNHDILTSFEFPEGINRNNFENEDVSEEARRAMMIEQINSTSDAIYNAVGILPSFFRPPFFGTNEAMVGIDLETDPPLPWIHSQLDTNDWQRGKTAQEIADELLTRARGTVDQFGRERDEVTVWSGGRYGFAGADGAIVLQHDAPVSAQTLATVEALRIFIPIMQEWGYEFVTLTELYETKGVEPEPFAQTWPFINGWAGDVPESRE